MFVAKTKFTRQAVGSFPQPNAKSIECQKKSQDCIRFVVLLFVIGPENLRHFLNQSNAKLELTASQQLAFSALLFLHFEFSKALVTSSLICSDLLL